MGYSIYVFFPVMVIGSIIHINIMLKPIAKFVVIGYLILTVGVASVPIGISFYKNNEEKKEIKQKDEYISNSIGYEIRKVYPDAEFYWYYKYAIVKLGGYKFENQPVFNYGNQSDYGGEIAKWKKIKSTKAFSNFPYKVKVKYYFENMENPFVSLDIENFYLDYYINGVSKEVLENIKVKIQQQLYKYYDNDKFNISYYDNDKINISYNNTIKVMINKKINTNTYEEKTTTERWKDFIKQNNINTDLVVINVEYRDLNTNSSRYYNVNRNEWSGSYNEAS